MKETNQSTASAATYQQRILIAIKETFYFTYRHFSVANTFTNFLPKCVKARLFYP